MLINTICVYCSVIVTVCAACFSSGKEERLMPIAKMIIINQSNQLNQSLQLNSFRYTTRVVIVRHMCS